MNTLAALLEWGSSALASSQQAQLDSTDAFTDAQVLLCFAVQKNRTFLYAFPETIASDQQIEVFYSAIAERQRGVPVAYIVGEREFWSLALYCDSSTLIPRPDTECVVEQVLSQVAVPDCRVVDLGTGTGAIALALATERPNWQITGIDSSDGAVVLAKRNAERHGLNVAFLKGDWLSGCAASSIDVIVSNPPYIAAHDAHISQGDVRFEPITALIAADNGMRDFNEIAKQGMRCLVKGGHVFFEHGYEQQAALISLLQDVGYENVTGFKDYAGQPRIVSAIKP